MSDKSESALEVLPSEPKDKRMEEIEKSEETQRNVAESLRRMGLTQKMTRRVFAGNTDGKMLKREICGRISLVFFANSLESLALAQKKCLVLARRKGLEAKDVAAALSVSVQAGNAVGNMGRIFMDAAGELDSETPKPPKAPTVVQQFNFPQVQGQPAPQLPQASSGEQAQPNAGDV